MATIETRNDENKETLDTISHEPITIKIEDKSREAPAFKKIEPPSFRDMMLNNVATYQAMIDNKTYTDETNKA